MVSKILQKLPVSRKGLLLHLLYVLILLSLLFVLKLDKLSFVIGFVFSYLYAALFFYSIKLIFTQKRKSLGLLLLFSKWLLLLVALILVAWYLDGNSFLLGLSAILAILLSYILDQLKKESLSA